MSLIRSKDTKPEMLVRRLIHRMGYRFRLHDEKLPGCPDLVFKSQRKAIFVHGCFWHFHRNCCRPPKSHREYWKPKLERNASRDKEASKKLRALGWRELVIWECQLADLDKLSRKIRQFLAA